MLLDPRLWNERIHPDDLHHRQRAMLEGIPAGSFLNYRVQIPQHSGILLAEEIRIIRNEASRATLIVGVTSIAENVGSGNVVAPVT